MEKPKEINLLEMKKTMAVKLFLNNVPESWNESNILVFFQKFGKVQDPKIIKNLNGEHGRCASITFLSMTEADCAIEILDGEFILPGSNHLMSIGWDKGESKRLGIENINSNDIHKLVIKNLEREVTTIKLFQYFEQFGQLKVISIVDTKEQFNKAYLKFAIKEQAIATLWETHEKMILPGTSTLMSVDYASNLRINKNEPFGKLANSNKIKETTFMQEDDVDMKYQPVLKKDSLEVSRFLINSI